MPLKRLVGCLVLALSSACASATVVRTEHVEAELVSASTTVVPGQPLSLGLRLKMIPHWHTYWRNPGDSGEPTAIEWKLPPGYSAGGIQWPAPQKLPIGPLLNYGYEKEVLLPVDIAVPSGASGTVTVAAKAKWLVCSDERCVPEEGEFSLVLPVGASGPTQWSDPIARSKAALPAKAPADWSFAAKRTAGGVDLEVRAPAGTALKGVHYFPFDEGRIHNAGTQAFDGTTLSIPRALQPAGPFNRVSGLLVAGPIAMEVDLPVTAGAPGGVAPSLALALLFAFAGGLILNLMPCVLPVLSIKVLGFAGAGPAALRTHGLLYGLGVISAFLLLAGLLLALKAFGHEVGWGFQLQSPVFVALLAVLFLALALNLSGLFEFGSFLPSGLASLQARNAHSDAFLTGVLAVAIASPCTAPFMGAALGYALAEDAPGALGVFAALGVGMALPYVALAVRPGWLRWLPKPGAWTVRFKQALALPLYATVIWLGWVFALQVAPGDVMRAEARTPDAWMPYSEARLAALAAEGKPVFVDFTAAWCVTCQVNKQLVLGQPEVERDFKARGVTLMRADWTRRDPEISRALAALGRNGVPVYVLYPPRGEAKLLPELLTRGAITAALEGI